MKINRIALFVIAASMTGCFGYTSRDNEAIGQPKKIHHNTPLTCFDYDTIDISLGVIRNGIGSMSVQDITLAFAPNNDQANENTLSKAIQLGKLVKFTYDEQRVTFCQPKGQIKTVETVEP